MQVPPRWKPPWAVDSCLLPLCLLAQREWGYGAHAAASDTEVGRLRPGALQPAERAAASVRVRFEGFINQPVVVAAFCPPMAA